MKKFIAVITAFSFLFAHRVYAYGLAPEDFNKMYSLAHAGKVYSLREAVHRGLNIDAVNANGNTGLCVAIYRGDQRAYNTFRAAGANPYHRCTNVIPTEQYENFMSSSRVIGVKETPRLAYNVIHTGYLWSPKFWTLASLGAVGIGVAAFSGGGGGGSSSPAPAPEIYNSLGTKIGTMEYIPAEDSEGSASTTKNLIFAIYSGLKQKEGEVEEIPNVLWVSEDYDPTAVVNSYKAISKPLSYADRIMVAYKMTDGLSANAQTNGNSLSNGQAAYVVSGWKTVKTKTEESSEPEFLTTYSTLRHTGAISMQSVSNAVYGIIASNLATAYNGDEGSSNGTISMSVLPEEYTSNTVIGMYADTGASIINGKQGKIKASLDTQSSSASGNDIVAENSVAGMVVGIIGPHLTDLPEGYSTEEEPREVINIAKNLGTINFELKDSAITRCLMNMIGMGSYLSTSASAYYLQTDKTELTNSGLISLLYYYVEDDDSTLLLSSGSILTSNGLQGTIGMRADTNTTATNTKSGIISINGIKDQSAGMLAVNGGTLINEGEIKVTPDPDDKNKYLAYGYGLVSLQGTRTGGSEIINNGTVTVSQNAIYSDTDVTITNGSNGKLTSIGAEAIRITDGAIETTITNKGTIEATAAKQYGIYSEAVETTNIDNSGTISSLRGSTDNYTIYSSSENVDLINSGTIIGPAGIKTDGSRTVNVVNTGTIESTSTISSGANDGIAINGSKNVTIQNEGTITGRCPIWIQDVLNDGITNIYNTGEIKVTDAYTALTVNNKKDNIIKEINIYNGATLINDELQECTDCAPTISDGQTSAISLDGTILAATINNYAKATLSGGSGIISSAKTNTINNSGIIKSTSGRGINLTSSAEDSYAEITNNGGATISSSGSSIYSSAKTTDIKNLGTIKSTNDNGIYLYSYPSSPISFTIINGDDGKYAEVSGLANGIYSVAISNTIRNYGKITGTNGTNSTGISLGNSITGSTVEIINYANATISGGKNGIYSYTITNTIENSGIITGSNSSGIYVETSKEGSDATITNNTGATVSGGDYGIKSNAITNTIKNSGAVTGSNSSGINLTSYVNTATIENYDGATIFSGTKGIDSSAVTTTIYNYGTITGDDEIGINLTSKVSKAEINNGDKDNHNATISGLSYGISSSAITNTITNFGTIEGTGTSAHGIQLMSSVADSNATITNNTGATISGGDYGISSNAFINTIKNFGTIKSTSVGAGSSGQLSGIYLKSSVAGSAENINTITNNINAIIFGSKYGIYYDAKIKALINNYGNIGKYNYANISYENGIHLTSNVSEATVNNGDENNHNATISGGTYGIYSQAENTTIDNYGTINGDNDGIHLISSAEDSSATITNSGTISGNDDGIYSNALKNTITNSGTIEGYYNNGIHLTSSEQGSKAEITNNAGATISGGTYGIYSRAENTTVDNYGIITGDNNGILLSSDNPATVTNYYGGKISGENGIAFSTDTALAYNYGTISATNNGITSQSYDTTINNYGTIESDTIGINLDEGIDATINNGDEDYADATISGDYGIVSGAITNTIENYGTITGSGEDGIHLISSAEDSSATITNSGTISGNDDGIELEEITTATITNNTNATISGDYGIYSKIVTNELSVNNYGNVTGGIEGIYLLSSVNNANITNYAGATILGDNYGIDSNAKYIAVNNFGNIEHKDISDNVVNNYGIYLTSDTNAATINNGNEYNHTATISGKDYAIYSRAANTTVNNYGIINGEINIGMGQVTNEASGVITISKSGSYGIYVTDGKSILNKAEATNKGTINVNGDNSYGMYAGGYSQATNKGTINVNGDNSYGMYADKAFATIYNHGSIYVTGNNSYGMSVSGSAVATNYGTIYYSPGSYCKNGSVSSMGGSCVEYTPSAAAPRLLTLNMMSLAAPMTEDSLASEQESESSDNPMPKAKSYALMVDNSGILQNNGSVYLGTNPDDASYIGSNAKIINNGLMAADESATLNVDNWKKSDDAVVEATKNSVFKAGSIAGTIQAGADIVVDDHNDTTYATTDTFDGNIDNLNLTSSLYLFKASKGTNNILMTMVDGGFKDVEQGQNVGAFLNNNYNDKDDRRSAMFNRIKVAEDKNNYAKIVNSELGLSFIPSITRQNLEFARNTAAQVTDAIYSNAKDKQANFVVGADYYHNRNSSTDTQMGYDSDGINIYGVYNENLNPSVNLGLGVSVGTNYSDFDNDSNSKQNVAQFYIPVTLSTEELSWLFMPRFGVGDGEYKRYVKDDKAYKADFTTYYYGLSNQLRKEFDLGYITIEPVAELNMLSMYTSKIKENNNLYVKSQDSVSIEGGLGLYFTKKVDFTNASKLQLRFGGTYYREMADPYSSVTAGFVDTDGTYKIRGYKNGRDRGVLSMQANYNIDQFDIYVKASQYIEKNSNLLLQAGMKYNIQ